MGLYIFDKDGTLIQLKRNRLGLGRPVKHPDEQLVIPGVRAYLDELRASGHLIAIASNMRAISQGLMTMEDAERMMKDCADKLGGVNSWRICPFNASAPGWIHGKRNPYQQDNDCHKPKPGMLFALMDELGVSAADTVMVGDSWRDRRAAQAAGVKFVPARSFFGEEWAHHRVI